MYYINLYVFLLYIFHLLGKIINLPTSALLIGEEELDVEEMSGLEKDTPSLSLTTETTTASWMREAGMDADIHSYAKGSLLRRSEYFFRIWYYARSLFK